MTQMQSVQWRSEGPAGPATAGGPAGLKGPARGPPGARQEEVVAITPWPGAQTSCLRGGPKIVATLLSQSLIICNLFVGPISSLFIQYNYTCTSLYSCTLNSV